MHITPTRTCGKKTRFALWTLGAIVLLCVAGALAARFLIDESRWIGILEQRASAATGHQVRVGGVAFHVLPMPGLDAAQVSIAGPAWAHEPQLLVAQKVSGRFALWPLLHGQLQPASLTAQGVRLNLETGADGSHSWTLPHGPGQAGHSALDLTQITSLELRQIEVRYRNPHTPPAAPAWQIDHLGMTGKPGWQQVQLDGAITHAGHVLTAHGHVDHLAAPATGHLTLHTGSANVTLDGALPMDVAMTGAHFTLHGEAARPNDVLDFFGIESRPLAPLSLSAEIRENGGALRATGVDAKLAKLHVTGAVQFNPHTDKPTLDAQLAMPRLDWVQTLADAGRPPLPPKLPGEMFRTHRLAWRVLGAMHGYQGTLDLHIGVLKTRPGIELTDAVARIHFVDDHAVVSPMHAGMLGGTAHGALQLTAHNKSAHLNLELHDVVLQKWIAALGKKAPLTGGPLNVIAAVDATGATMKELAASLTGPVSIKLGPTVITSAAGSRAEELLTGLRPIFSAHKSGQIVLECAAANLSFANGRAVGAPLVGARSEASQLLTSGFVDLREQTLDLRGRVRARAGISLGLSTLGGDVKITGLLTHPQAKLDPAGTPAALARLGAAFATAGLSIVATALWDTANPGTDACQAVFLKNNVSAHIGEKAIR